MFGKIKSFLLRDREWPMGLATFVLFGICLTCYYLMSPHYGQFLTPTVMQSVPNDPNNWLLWAVKLGLLGGFCHGSLAHLMYNMTLMLPCMVVIEKYRGPLEMVCLYLLMSVVGYVFLYHMTGSMGIGSSCAGFGMAFVSVFLMTKGISRLVLLAPLIVLAMEAAKWWMGMLGDTTAHLGHLGGMVVGILYCFASGDK